MFRCHVVTAVTLLLLHCLLVNDWLSVLIFCILLSLLSLWLASSLSLSLLLLEVSTDICLSVDHAAFSTYAVVVSFTATASIDDVGALALIQIGR
jgi:hypothetical protein